MGFGLGSIVNSVFGSGGDDKSKSTSTSTATPMTRPTEYDEMWESFMGQYLEPQLDEEAYLKKYPDIADMIKNEHERATDWFGGTAQGHWDIYGRYEGREATFLPSYKDQLNQTYEEQRQNTERYLSDLTGLKAPYLSTVADAMNKHSGTLDEIITKRMAGENVGPYAADIDQLLGERTGISFGGGDPMGFITKGQASLLKDLLGAQETALTNIQGTSEQRAAADITPVNKMYNMGREIADLDYSKFMPSTSADISYLQSLYDILQPMEMTRYHATPSVSGTATDTPTQAQQAQSTLSNLSDITDLTNGIMSMFAGA